MCVHHILLTNTVHVNKVPQIKDALGNDYGRPRDVVGEARYAFNAHEDSAFDVCFENIITSQNAGSNPSRAVELDIDIGADAKDWSAIQAGEKLKPVEAELKKAGDTSLRISIFMDVCGDSGWDDAAWALISARSSRWESASLWNVPIAALTSLSGRSFSSVVQVQVRILEKIRTNPESGPKWQPNFLVWQFFVEK